MDGFWLRFMCHQTGHSLKKVLIQCVWLARAGLIHYKFLESGKTTTVDIYLLYLENFSDIELQKQLTLVNRKEIILLHDNACRHTANATMHVTKTLGLLVFPHLPYSRASLHGKIFCYLFLSIDN